MANENQNVNNILIGHNADFKAPNYFVGVYNQVIANDANAIMFYTGAPQNTARAAISLLKIDEGRKLFDSIGFKAEQIVIHAPYIVNLGNVEKQDLFKRSVEFLSEEVRRSAALGAANMVLHPGSASSSSKPAAMDQIARGLNYIIENTKDLKTKISLETMSGKGNEVGTSFEELKYIIDQVSDKSRIAVCIDTCHIWDAGYDIVNNLESIVEDFDRIIGLEFLSVIHLNDSKNELSSHKDRHQNIIDFENAEMMDAINAKMSHSSEKVEGGFIGAAALGKLAAHPKLRHVPLILETPYTDKKLEITIYKEEIKLIRSIAN